jgi:hypothetical protein
MGKSTQGLIRGIFTALKKGIVPASGGASTDFLSADGTWGVPAGSSMTDAQVKTAYENNANTNEYSDSEKSKLAGLDSSKFLGEYVTLGALQTAHPSPVVGSYANVDAGVGTDVKRYIWDSDDNAYVEQLGTSTILTDAQIKTQYENNANTNAFTDSRQSEVIANTAKTTNVSTDLSIGTITGTTVEMVSSDGTNAIIPRATTVVAGLLTGSDQQKLDGIENNATVDPTLSKTFTLQEPTASDDITIFRTDVAITVVEVMSVNTGTTPSTTYILKHHTSRSNVGNDLIFSRTTTDTGGGNTTTLDDATIPANSWIWFESTAASGTDVYLSIDIRYTED